MVLNKAEIVSILTLHASIISAGKLSGVANICLDLLEVVKQDNPTGCTGIYKILFALNEATESYELVDEPLLRGYLVALLAHASQLLKSLHEGYLDIEGCKDPIVIRRKSEYLAAQSASAFLLPEQLTPFKGVMLKLKSHS